MATPVPPPPDAIGALEELIATARHVFSMFEQLVAAGFTEDQALRLCAAALGGQR